MPDLHFVDFALIPSPVRKEKQFRLPDDFSKFDFTDSLTDEPFRVWFSRAFSSFHIAGRPLFGDLYLKCFTRRGRRKKFQHFRSQRLKSSLTSRCKIFTGKIIGGIKGFLASKASILWTNYCLTARKEGVLPEKLGGGVRPASQNPYPIYDHNLRYSLPYL